MKTNFLRATVAIGLLWIPVVVLGVTWQNKNVASLQALFSGADCFYFTLEGVSEADPALPGNAWFAVPRTQYGAKDTYAMLLAAKLTEKPVIVSTTGGSACGYAAVHQVWMQ